MNEGQPIVIRTVDFVKNLARATAGINTGRMASRDGKIVEFNANGKLTIDYKGIGTAALHSIAPTTANHIAQEGTSSIGDSSIVDAILTGATLAGAFILKDGSQAVEVFAGLNVARNAVLYASVPAIEHSAHFIRDRVVPHFRRLPAEPGNPAQ